MKLPNTPLLDTGAGQPMILLNGMLGGLHTWRFCVQEFSKAYRILIPRLPLTSYPFSEARINDLVTYLEAFIDDHVRGEPVVMIGAFRGGCIAALYALRNPGRVEKLVLSGSLGLFDQAFPEQRPSQKLPPVHWPATEIFDGIGSSFADDSAIDRSESTWPEVNSAFQKDATRAIFCRNHELHVLLIWGRNDKRSPSTIAWQYCELLENPEIIFIEDCGHAPLTEQPEIFNRIVWDYLGEP